MKKRGYLFWMFEKTGRFTFIKKNKTAGQLALRFCFSESMVSGSSGNLLFGEAHLFYHLAEVVGVVYNPQISKVVRN